MRRDLPALLSAGWLFIVCMVSITAPMISNGSPYQPVAEPLTPPEST